MRLGRGWWQTHVLGGVVLLALSGAGCAGEASLTPATGAGPAGSPSSMNSMPVGGVQAGSSAAVPQPTASAAPAPMPIGSGQGPQPGAVAGSAPVATDPLPCGVQKVVGEHCQACHGATLVGGAPMPLLGHADFHKRAVTRPDLEVYQLSRLRIADTSRPMPPAGRMPDAAFATFDGWLAAGASAGTAADVGCEQAATGSSSPAPAVTEDPRAGLVPLAGETCYEFPTHGAQTEADASPYMIRTGEHYHQFYFKAPWPAGVVATRFGARFDNIAVLHHWLLLSSGKSTSLSGTSEDHSGSQFGDDARLLAGWAVGGNNFEAPPDVGLELPAPNTLVHTQWHFFNRTNTEQADHSVVQVCTVPASARANIASMTWLGSESINVRPGATQDVTGTCPNDSNAPITIIAFWPHMHNLGSNMRSAVRRSNGMMEAVFDKPFQFDHQYYYSLAPQIVLAPGESITTTCTFANDTDANVQFGESTTQEMCYQFTVAYPARALDNGVFSLIGVNDTCW